MAFTLKLEKHLFVQEGYGIKEHFRRERDILVPRRVIEEYTDVDSYFADVYTLMTNGQSEKVDLSNIPLGDVKYVIAYDAFLKGNRFTLYVQDNEGPTTIFPATELSYYAFENVLSADLNGEKFSLTITGGVNALSATDIALTSGARTFPSAVALDIQTKVNAAIGAGTVVVSYNVSAPGKIVLDAIDATAITIGDPAVGKSCVEEVWGFVGNTPVTENGAIFTGYGYSRVPNRRLEIFLTSDKTNPSPVRVIAIGSARRQTD